MSRELPEVCKLIWPGFLAAIEKDILKYSPPDTRIHREGLETLQKLSNACGFEKEGDIYVQFPKQRDAVERVCQIYTPGGKGKMGHCEIVEEHGDGDLTVKTEDNIFVITTDGRVFREIQPLDR